MWENFLVSERIKQLEYKQSLARVYFWRTKQQREIDFVEENAGLVTGFEFKWQKRKNTGLPSAFINAYKANTLVIDRNNFRDFVIIKSSDHKPDENEIM